MEERQEEKQLAVAKEPRIMAWADRADVREMSIRVRKFMPGGDKLSDAEALILAQYALTMDANPFRGEVYAYVDKRGQLCLVEGYKLLVRWCKRQGDYLERYEPISGLPDGDVGFRCWIFPLNRTSTVQQFVKMGADFKTAYELASTWADGVVRKMEKFARDGHAISPPAGWTWEQTARKRALKAALRLAYGAPSPREIARETWMVADTQTQPDDWTGLEQNMPTVARERVAELSAQTRDALEEFRVLSPEEQQAALEQNRLLLHGEDDEL